MCILHCTFLNKGALGLSSFCSSFLLFSQRSSIFSFPALGTMPSPPRPPSAPQFCWLPLQDLRSTAFRYLLQHGVPGPTWGDREFLPTARRPGRTRQGGASPQLLGEDYVKAVFIEYCIRHKFQLRAEEGGDRATPGAAEVLGPAPSKREQSS